MARNVNPQCRMCRAYGVKLFLKGDRCKGNKCPVSKRRGAPGKGPTARTRRKVSDYGLQLREKQKLKRTYGMLEKQFKLFFDRAEKKKGVTGDNLIKLLESRLDNVVYRMHMSSSRKEARQIISHGHVMVNNRKVSIPSYMAKQGDVVEIKETSKKLTVIKDGLKEYSRSGVVPWLEVDPDAVSGKVNAIPGRNDVADLANINEQLIVELYSK